MVLRSFKTLRLTPGYPLGLCGVWLAIAVVLIGWSMHWSEGHLIYTLDDPYIHLAVAETILKGGYGINDGEYSAPSSSIIYPFLLAITGWAGLGSWGPLLINLLAMGMAVYLAGCIIRNQALTQVAALPPEKEWRSWPIGVGLLVCLNMNAWALVMTGMEHSLHVLAVVVTVWGLLKVLDDHRAASPWLVGAIIAMPLIRFEGLAMALVTAGLLFWTGQRGAPP